MVKVSFPLRRCSSLEDFILKFLVYFDDGSILALALDVKSVDNDWVLPCVMAGW